MRLLLTSVLLLSSCYADELEEIKAELENPEWPQAWEYASVCFQRYDMQCDYSGVDSTINCTNGSYVSCVDDTLSQLGAEGWRVELGEDWYPASNRVYLMYRAAEQ